MSALIPNSAIRENYEKSVYYYSDKSAFAFTNGKKLNAAADHYADSIWLGIAWNIGNGHPFAATLQTAYYDGEALGENAGLYYTVAEDAAPNVDYTRYWHGTAMFIRPLHLFTDIQGIKAVGFSLFLLLLAITLLILVRKKHLGIAVLLSLALLAVQIWNIRLSLEYQPSFLIAFAIIPPLLILEGKNDKWLTVFAVIGGTATAFFDFLTTETVTLLLPLALVVAVRAKENRLGDLKKSALLLFRCGVAWACAYIAAFLVKWGAASAVSHTNAFSAALSSVAERIGGQTEIAGDMSESFFSSAIANLSVLFGSETRIAGGRVFVGLLLTALLLLSVWYLFRSDKKASVAAYLLLGLGGLVLIRYLILNNHSYLHCFFTYRALVTPIFALGAAVYLNIKLPLGKGR